MDFNALKIEVFFAIFISLTGMINVGKLHVLYIDVCKHVQVPIDVLCAFIYL